MRFEDVQVTAEEETFAAVNNLEEFYYLGKKIPLYLFARPSLNLPLLCSPLPLDKTWKKPTSAGPEVLGKNCIRAGQGSRIHLFYHRLHTPAQIRVTGKGGLKSHILEHKEKGVWLQVKG